MIGTDPERRPRIVFLSPYDPRDRRRWSGTIHSIFVALQDRDPNVRFISGGIFDPIVRATRKLLRLNADIRFSAPFAWLAGSYASVRLWTLRADAVVAVAAANYLAFLRTRKPIIYISDTTFAAIERLYPEFGSFPRWLRRHANRLESRALRRAAHVIYPSEWARHSAIEDYGIASSKIMVMPFGPNLSKEVLDRFRAIKAADYAESLRLLYIAVDWKRKNGDFAIEIARTLRRAGWPCELFLVGRIPPTVGPEEGIHIIGPLDKNDPADLNRVCELYQSAHFFVMPTVADASPIVFSEAQAFGCPCITFDVGGTSSAVLDNETGIVLPLTATAEDFARRIEQLIRDPASYQAMSRNTRRRYEEQANWERWAQTIMQLASLRNTEAPRG
jgi:glycosyltransferase involved in cell wall biosynthesis